jgi:hypothetical protein
VFFVKAESKGVAGANGVKADSKGFKTACLYALRMGSVKAANKGLAGSTDGGVLAVEETQMRQNGCGANFIVDSSTFHLPCQ